MPNTPQGLYRAPADRITVEELFARYMQFFARLPGDVSEFDQSELGYEWRCEFELGMSSTAINRPDAALSLQLHFSVVDLDRFSSPAAVLYLVACGPRREDKNRLPLSLQDLEDTQEQLNQELLRRDATLETFADADRFILALTSLKNAIADRVAWT
jgi:hypothetical protein